MTKIIQYIAFITSLALGYSCTNTIIKKSRSDISSVFHYHSFFDKYKRANSHLKVSSQSNDYILLDEIAATILSEPKLIKHHYHPLVELLRLSNFRLKNDSTSKDYPTNILEFLPFPNQSYKFEKLYIDEYIINPYIEIYPLGIDYPTWHSKKFPIQWNLYEDFLHVKSGRQYLGPMNFLSTSEIRNENYKYLFLQLPNFYKITSAKQGRMLNESQLMFEPAFAKYDKSIMYLWYLIKLKIQYYDNYKNLFAIPDTIFNYKQQINSDIINQGSFVVFTLSNHDQKYSDYILKNYENDQKLHKSYFELIFWQLYKTSEFKVKDNNGEKRSFLFTSNNPQYPGNYEVKFNIYEPYHFKVIKR